MPPGLLRSAIQRNAAGAAALLIGWTGTAEGQVQSPASGFDHETSSASAVPNVGSEREIVIEGRRSPSEKYRIPPALRTLPPERDHRADAFDPRLGCRMVGPRGCGTPVLPIFTVTGDGKVRIGAAKEQEQ
jgi:hypothetical protein